MACRMIRSRQSSRPGRSDGSAARADGSVNLAPYSYFNAISDHPKMVMFSSIGPQGHPAQCRGDRRFTTSMVGRELAEKMNLTSANAPYGENEFGFSGLEMAEARLINAPFVAEAHAALECKVTELFQPKTLDGQDSDAFVVIGQVVGIHIDEAALGRWQARHGGGGAFGAAGLHGLRRWLPDFRTSAPAVAFEDLIRSRD
jgi:flavin reductase (DIM6/NTAB) family NADH-FMN oxidoreductase RutF